MMFHWASALEYKKHVLTCKVFEILAFVFESICGPLIPLVFDLPRVPRENPRSSW